MNILIGVHTFAYCIADSKKQVLTLRDYQIATPQHAAAAWQQLRQEDAWLGMTFGHVNLLFDTPHLLALPASLFQSEQIELYLQSAYHQLPANLYSGYEQINADTVVVFGADNLWQQILSDAFPQARRQSAAATLLQYLAQQPAGDDDGALRVYAHVQEHHATLAVFDKERQLQFLNGFEFRAASDFLYFTMLLFQQLQLDAQTQPLYLSGSLLAESEVYSLLHKYIRHLHFLPAPAAVQFSTAFDSIERHTYAELWTNLL